MSSAFLYSLPSTRSLASRSSPLCTVSHPRRPPASLSRRAFLLSILLYPLPSRALCGEPDPFYAHYLPWEEYLTVRTETHARRVGTLSKERRAHHLPVLYLSDPGLSISSAETLDLLAKSDRRVLSADFLGTGFSTAFQVKDPFDDMLNQAVELLAEERLGEKGNPSEVHLVAAGGGIEVARRLVEEEPHAWNVKSVVVEAWQKINPAEVAKGNICLEKALEEGKKDVVQDVYGNASGWEKQIASLAEKVPVLVLGGNNFQGPATWKQVDRGGRLPHVGNMEQTLEFINQFLDQVEAVDTK